MSLFVDNPFILWSMLIGFVVFRTILPIRCKYDFTKIPIIDAERTEWKSLRDQNMVLASFTIVAIAIIFALQPNMVEKEKSALFYFSLAIFSFIIGSYLFRFSTDRRIPYTGETLEFAGLISLGIGFTYLINNLVQDWVFDLIYSAFFIGIMAVSAIDLYLNYSWFYPKSEPNG